jgi:hypothetical protein
MKFVVPPQPRKKKIWVHHWFTALYCTKLNQNHFALNIAHLWVTISAAMQMFQHFSYPYAIPTIKYADGIQISTEF